EYPRGRERQDRGDPHEPDRPADGRWTNRRATIAEPGLDAHDSGVGRFTSKADAERAGHGGLAPGRVGAWVLAPVAPAGYDGESRALVHDERCQRDQEPRQPRGDEGCGVIEPRGGPSQVAIALVAVADHAVEGARRLERPERRGAANQQPEERGDDGV